MSVIVSRGNEIAEKLKWDKYKLPSTLSYAL